ncbi:hypothetical protein AD945_03225 [Gluconobacter albidus]|uniref:Uncharacterized protein n=1 Tax=Gluconobacter albidus TaxID=318683 RepID=A0A149TLU2_9PROT|nr:hypothetical protein [Gluconobacter albidus]KXV49868.1 hypothetical protein AD945_03225 [Gluconobacter albidus]
MFYSSPAPSTAPRSQARAFGMRLLSEAAVLDDSDHPEVLTSRTRAGFRRTAATLRRRSHDKILDSLDRPEGVA